MRIELPTRTVENERHLQNSTNNLINRHEHRLYFMLAWHSTNAYGGVRTNEVRSYVLGRVAAAQTPLPPNSTRGITPGLIDPLLGNVPGNVIPQPVRRINQGRLRVGGRAAMQAGAPATAQAYPLPTIAPRPNQAPASPPRDNQGSSNHGHNKQARNKRRRKTQLTSSESEGEIADDSSDGSNASDVCIQVSKLQPILLTLQRIPLQGLSRPVLKKPRPKNTLRGKGKTMSASES